jgi:predicted Zn-dependent protease
MKTFWQRCLPVALAAAFVGAPAMPVSAQTDIGQQMEQQYGVMSDGTSEGRRYNAMLDSAVTKIVRAVNSDKEYSSFKLRSAKLLGGKSEKNDKVINAFALPDGRIYVTLGLMRILESSQRPEDELAFVVGHEVTHVVEKHSASQAKKSLPVSIAAILLGAATRNRTIGTIAGAGAAAYGASFSRKDEYKADRGGLIFMHRAGYETDAAVSMLGRLKSAGESKGGPNAWFASHPATESRVNKVRNMIADINSGRRPDPND